MKSLKCFAVCAAALLVMTVVAEQLEAQGRGGRGRGGGFMQMGGRGNMLSLLQMEEVRKELELDEEKAQQLADLAEDVQAEMRDELQALFQDFREMSDDERAEAREEMQEIVAKINADAKKEMDGLLNDKQKKRLQELFIQRQGVNALMSAEVQKELEISKEQKASIAQVQQELAEERQEAMAELRDSGNFDREAMQEMMAEFREKTEAGMMKVLTDSQKEKFKKMQGKAFEFPRRGGRGRGR